MTDFEKLIEDSCFGLPSTKRIIQRAPGGIAYNQKLIDEANEITPWPDEEEEC